MTPGALPTVASTIPPRSAARPASDWALVPSPLIGMLICATWRSGDTVTLNGPLKWPLATARRSSAFVAATNCDVVTSLALTVTIAGICPPGKAPSMRS